jgi:hypothetical protein
MKSKILVLCLAGFFLLLGLSIPGTGQQPKSMGAFQEDTVDIGVSYTTAYPGSETWLEVSMRNPMPVSGYDLELWMGNLGAARFCRDDTGGCVTSTGDWVDGCECFGDPCGGVSIWWNGDMPIPPGPNYQTLFRICARTCCHPDTTTDRCATIYNMGSWAEDEYGQVIPIRYRQGRLCLWWSVPGDASGDSLVTVADAVFLVNYLYRGGSEPCMCEAADCNSDCVVEIGDLVYLLNYLFRNGLQPVPGCAHCPHEDCLPE